MDPRRVQGFGPKFGKISKGGFVGWAQELASGNPTFERVRAAMLRARNALRAEMTAQDKRVRNLAKGEVICRQLMTVPGVGPQTALTFTSAWTASAASAHRGGLQPILA
ncbi:hypothetical protein [Palleronia marisminoris]|uniref:hypothetical protein n=1 Tax=Palleronia marisminoris TaxID=315423 RepID=UPI001587BFBC|nr:hypothetical protein [Palleronia marisminoris]